MNKKTKFSILVAVSALFFVSCGGVSHSGDNQQDSDLTSCHNTYRTAYAYCSQLKARYPTWFNSRYNHHDMTDPMGNCANSFMCASAPKYVSIIL